MSLIRTLSDWNRRRLAKRKFAKLNKATPDYQTWVARFSTPQADELAAYRQEAAQGPSPLISILIPTYNPDPKHLELAIQSALDQTYPNLEVCVADDASTDPRTRQTIEMYAARDPRLKFVFRAENGHISDATNSALSLAQGEYVTLLDQDDLLAPHALSVMVRELRAHPDTEIAYSDEDKVDDKGWRSNPHFKPDWNHTLALAQNYVCHLMVLRRALVESVGGFKKGMEGAQDHDLLLRCIERIDHRTIRHVPEVLYHWRVHERSTARKMDSKPYAQLNGQKAVAEHLQRCGIPGSVNLEGLFYRVKLSAPATWPKVSVVIPTRDRPELLDKCLSTVLTRTDYPDVEYLIVDNGTTDPEALAKLDRFANDPRVQVIKDDSPFNYSALNNLAVKRSSGSVVCLLNNDIEVQDPGWLREMVTCLQLPDVGIVGCRLYYPDGSLQHAGVIVGLSGTAGHIFRGQARNDAHYMHRSMLRQELSAVTAACLVTSREVYDALQGLDTGFAVAFNDIDFCLRARKRGWKVIYTPHAELVHHESASRGQDRSPEQKTRLSAEKARLIHQHSDFIAHDPAYNPNLTIEGENASLASRPRLARTPRATN